MTKGLLMASVIAVAIAGPSVFAQAFSRGESPEQAKIRLLAEISGTLSEISKKLDGGGEPDPPAPEPEPLPAPEPVVEFSPVTQHLAQVLDLTQMKELDKAGWKWGYLTFTNQSKDLTKYLADVRKAKRYTRVSVNRNWFTTGGQLNAMGEIGVRSLVANMDIITGIEAEGMPNRDKAYVSLVKAMGEQSFMVGGYQNGGKNLDHYSRLWYSLYHQNDPQLGKLKVWRHDSGHTYPAYVVQSRKPQRTPDNLPKKGVSTAHLWLQVSGEMGAPSFSYTPPTDTDAPRFSYNGKTSGIWTKADGRTGQDREVLSSFIRPGRTHMHYQLLVADLVGANAVTWYTNGKAGTRDTMAKYQPKLLADLIHVIKAYEAQEVIKTWEPDYKKRNPWVTHAPVD